MCIAFQTNKSLECSTPMLSLFKKRRIRTARCLLTDGAHHLLVVHAGGGRDRRPRWGLPGGHLDLGERPEDALRRELVEELHLEVEELEELGDWSFRGGWHRVYTAPLPAPVTRFDRGELLEIGWHDLDAVASFAKRGMLHAGYEIEVVRQLRGAAGELTPERCAS